VEDPKAPAAARALASNSILDRAYDKPPRVPGTAIARSARDLTDEEPMAIIASQPDAATEH